MSSFPPPLDPAATPGVEELARAMRAGLESRRFLKPRTSTAPAAPALPAVRQLLGPLVGAAGADVRPQLEPLAGLVTHPAPPRRGKLGGFIRLVRRALKKFLNPWLDAQTRFNRQVIDSLESSARAQNDQARFNCAAIDALEASLWALQAQLAQVRTELQASVQALTNHLNDSARRLQAERAEHEQRVEQAVRVLGEQTEEALAARVRQAGLYFRPAIAVEFAEEGARVARVSARILENIFIHSRLPATPARVLALGCGDNTSALEMASLGFQVVGVASPPPLQHPNLETVQPGAAGLPFPDASFDVVVSLSDLEGDAPDAAADRKVSAELARVLRPGGRLLLTVPYGKAAAAAPRRVYDRAALAELLRPFRVLEKGFGVRTGETWAYSTDEQRAGETDSRGRIGAVALVAAERP